MVLKLCECEEIIIHLFENDVKMYGTQASTVASVGRCSFENDVKMYGTQAVSSEPNKPILFENDVKMYGTQAYIVTY